jgi:hypothetical protein
MNRPISDISPRAGGSPQSEGRGADQISRVKAPDFIAQRTGKGAACRDRVGATAPAGRNACYGHGSQVRHGLGEGGAGGEGKSAR